MVSLDDLSNLKIYRKEFFLPINPKDKKHNALIMLLTPNFNSSIKAMQMPYMVNRKYYESYYLEKDVYRYITSEGSLVAPRDDEFVTSIDEMDLPWNKKTKFETRYGIPEQKKFRLSSISDIKSAIKFFDKADNAHQSELAKNIIDAIKDFKADNIHVSKSNPFFKFFSKAFPDMVKEEVEFTSLNVPHRNAIDIEEYNDYFLDNIREEFAVLNSYDTSIQESKKDTTKYFFNTIFINPAKEILVYINNKNELALPGEEFSISDSIDAKIKTYYKNNLDIDITEYHSLYNYTPDDCYYTYYITKYTGNAKNVVEHSTFRFMTAEEIITSNHKLNENLKYFLATYAKKSIQMNIDKAIDKAVVKSNIAYTGFLSSINDVESSLNYKMIKADCKMVGISYPKYTINIEITNNINADTYVDSHNISVKNKKAYLSLYKDYDEDSYRDYLALVRMIFVYNTLNENCSQKILYPVAIYKSGIAKEDIDGNNHKFIQERVVKYIDSKYGNKEINRIVKMNDIAAFYAYAKEYFATGIMLEDDYKRSILKSLSEEADTGIDKAAKLGDSIKSKLRAIIKHKLAKIRRDVARGNTGTDSRDTTSLQRVQGNNIAQIPQISTPKTEAVYDDTLGCVYSLTAYTEYFNPSRFGQYRSLLEVDNRVNTKLRNAVYQDRIRNNKQVIKIYNNVKAQVPFIKFTYVNMERYMNRNVFFDLSYYMESYLNNMNMTTDDGTNGFSKRSMGVFKALMERLLTRNDFSNYTKKTVFIPVLSWNLNNTKRMWMYRESLNPISIIYNMMTTNPKELKDLFKDMDVVFLGSQNYFKMNFSELDFVKDKTIPARFVELLRRFIRIGNLGVADPDPEDEPTNSAKGIAMDIVDKVEKSQNVEIKSVEPIMKASNKIIPTQNTFVGTGPSVSQLADNKEKAVKKVEANKSDTTVKVKPVENEIKQTKEDIKASTKIDNTKQNNAVNIPDKEVQKDKLVKVIAKAAENSADTDEALDKLDDDEFKELLKAIATTEEDSVQIDKTRASRMVQISDDFQKQEVQGKSVKDLLNEKPEEKPLEKTSLQISSIDPCWKNLTFTNFDKTYDPDSDIVKMLDNMKNWKFPIVVRNLEVKDNSTSEDFVNLWKIECEDFKGARFTLKVDVPKFINDKFLKLRGNEKVLMIQATMMPILKTDVDACQIIGVGGYNKIFVYRYGNTIGKSLPTTDRMIKAITKYKGNELKYTLGDNRKICNKYELPIDYIDLSGYFDSIETKKYKIYFNQDELRKAYQVDDSIGIPIGIDKSTRDGKYEIIYYNSDKAKTFKTISSYIWNLICGIEELRNLFNFSKSTGRKYMYSQASILSQRMPLILVCAYLEGLTQVLSKAHITYEIVQKITTNTKSTDLVDYIPFKDGYIVYDVSYTSSLLLNGLKDCDTESYSIQEINKKEMYLDFLSKYGNLKSDGIENSYDCMVDPITKEILQYYKLPTDYVSLLLHANLLLADNKFIKHTDVSVRRLRRKELIAGYFYKALSNAYQTYANQHRRSRRAIKMTMKQSAVIDLLLSGDPAISDLSVNNAINDVECSNTVTSKGLVGMNTDRAYSLDKRGYDDSMLNVMGMSTGFSGNVGINRQATIDCNIEGSRGFVKPIEGDTAKFDTAKTLTITEALTPLGTTHDDVFRTLMTYVQTSKHMVRTTVGDPLLVTNGSDEAMPYLVSDIFAFKAKKDGKVVEFHINDEKNPQNAYMVIEYKDGSHDYIDLSEQVKKNSDGGYDVPLKLTTDLHEGSSIKAGQIVAYDKASFTGNIGEDKNIALNVGTLAKVAIMNTDEGFEDAASCTEEFAKKLGTEVIISIEKTFAKTDNVYLKVKIGDHINQGDVLIQASNSYDDDLANNLMKNLNMNTDQISELAHTPITSKYAGIIEDIQVLRTAKMEELSDSLKSICNAYSRKIGAKKKVYEKYGLNTNTLPSTDIMPNVGKTKDVYDGVKIIFKVKYVDTMSIGDKVVFYSANKGTLKYLIPEGKEPYPEFRPNEHVDAFVSIGSINGRMVCSTQIYGSLAKLMIELDRTCKDMAGIPYAPHL